MSISEPGGVGRARATTWWVSYGEYLAYERDSGLEHEFDDGEILEVLSPSTEEEDRGNEWQHYQLLESLREYVLVSQSHPRVEHYRRLASGAWEYRDFTTGVVTLDCGAELDLAALYAELPT